MYVLGALSIAQHKNKNNNGKKKKKKREEKMEERKEKSRTAFRTCIYSERLLGGARQGEREIKEGQRKTNKEKKRQEMCKRLEKFLDGVERLENERRK